ncbi:MAG: GTPase HflX [Opitutia bacterium TMED67]|nr:GTPase HflX [Verrucomicrobiales bacterium]OUU73454.1 MAG: GTPase HflX [Opitutae bacterium TMED67]RZO57694.1 MAG: GTPase HflX [Limisphaerales bacterium]
MFMVGVQLKADNAWCVEESMDELSELVTTAGAIVVGRGSQRLDKFNAATFIGPGKAKEFSVECKESNVDTVVFDEELNPAQGRNLEKIFECKILDRTALILDIFSQRAQTREGKLQVELAQLNHLLPRLTRFWTHLSRQKGGIGMRGGDGESQLEVDRRKVRERIGKIQRDLDLVMRNRDVQRTGRKRNQWPLGSMVGYTNAGKSTLFNAITGASTLSEDKLFATLDPTTRRLKLPTNQNVLLSDTVGFIRKLPHDLIDAFKATLEEVIEADLLLHIVDVSSPYAEEQIEAVNLVLKDLGVEEKRTLMIFNKVDRISSSGLSKRFTDQYSNSIAVSAKTGEGFDELMAELGKQLRPIRKMVGISIPHSKSDIIARLHEVGQVLERNYDGDEAMFKALIPPNYLDYFEQYLTNEDDFVNT